MAPAASVLMGNLFCCRRGYELFKARYAKDRIEPIDVDAFNNFDFLIVVASFCFLGSSSGGAVSALRMLRLVRLLTFIKGVPQLRVIVSGLMSGMKSVSCM